MTGRGVEEPIERMIGLESLPNHINGEHVHIYRWLWVEYPVW